MAKQANAKQRKWMRDISDFIGEVGLGGLYGHEYENRYDFQLHHVLGRTARHNKVPIGHWFIIPVPIELHDIKYSDNPLNVTTHKKAFIKEFGDQRGIFQILYSCMNKWNDTGSGYEVPNIEVYNAIMDTNA